MIKDKEMKRKRNVKRKKKVDMATAFVIASIAGIMLTLLFVLLSHGDIISEIFFVDSLDVGMDFFHSIEYTRGRTPYELYYTVYPPLANLLFYMMFRCTPFWQAEKWAGTFSEGIAARGTSIDLRVWQPTMLMFIVFIMLASVALVLLIKRITINLKGSDLLSLCFLFSYGVLYSFDRGNIVILSAICSMVFVMCKDSENKVISEIGLIALAVGAGLKIYPAILGILLLYDRQYKKAIRAVLYGIFLFVAPMFIFREGIRGFDIFFEVLFRRVGAKEIAVTGFSFDKIVNSLVIIFSQLFNLEIHHEVLLGWTTKMNVLAAAVVGISGFFVKKYWQKILAACLMLVLIQSQGMYIACFFIIPLVFMIVEEKNVNKSNFIPFGALVVTQLMLPIYDREHWILSLEYGRYQVCVVILLIYGVVVAVRNVVTKVKSLGDE